MTNLFGTISTIENWIHVAMIILDWHHINLHIKENINKLVDNYSAIVIWFSKKVKQFNYSYTMKKDQGHNKIKN